MARTSALALLPLAGALALAACGGASDADTDYETEVKDESGGELIVTKASEAPVEDVDIPDTPMTPVAPSGAATATPAAE